MEITNNSAASGSGGGWVQLYSGVKFYPLDPNWRDITIIDIAHASSKLTRFGGHTKGELVYPLAQHCVLVSYLCKNFPLWGLLHDASEALGLVDLPRPVKYAPGWGEGYRVKEKELMMAVATRFDLGWPEPREVVLADKRILLAEKRDLLEPNDVEWQGFDGVEPYPFKIEPWSTTEAKMRFLARYHELTATYNKVAA